ERLEQKRDPELGFFDLSGLEPGVEGLFTSFAEPEDPLIWYALLWHIGPLDQTKRLQAGELYVYLALRDRPEAPYRTFDGLEHVVARHRSYREQTQDGL